MGKIIEFPKKNIIAIKKQIKKGEYKIVVEKLVDKILESGDLK
ncbi:flagellar biosynthesis anti-sigma factor FlgM [Alicyclobacillus fodiniaquatilis]|uniref:Flagellar biosynthesis anti-sigma factor FlgM n=1 Tax=Alicyclobacillus fodiniaquatilis TaxID=1661150 RepID=A0ABW4JP40_9BACL